MLRWIIIAGLLASTCGCSKTIHEASASPVPNQLATASSTHLSG
jgi:hypothetical protein